MNKGGHRSRLQPLSLVPSHATSRQFITLARRRVTLLARQSAKLRFIVVVAHNSPQAADGATTGSVAMDGEDGCTFWYTNEHSLRGGHEGNSR
jgi:hypothetical protein